MKKLTAVQTDLVAKNMPLITYITKRYYQGESRTAWDDMWQTAALGLVKAAQGYDSSRGAEFGTYACRVMQNEILMQQRKNRKHTCCTSLDKAVMLPNGEEGSFYELLPDEHHPMEELEEKLLLEGILENTRKEMILDYFGIYRRPLRQKELAEKYGISQSYVSRLIHKELRAVRMKVEGIHR